MWENAEVVALVDEKGIVRSVSRNEEEAPVQNIIGKHVLAPISEDMRAEAEAALKAAQEGKEIELMTSAVADEGYTFWSRVRLILSPEGNRWVLMHIRRLPRSWGLLSDREREVVTALHTTGMNPKKAAQQLGISVNTLNAHRRTICQKCNLDGVGDFWVFVEHCR